MLGYTMAAFGPLGMVCGRSQGTWCIDTLYGSDVLAPNLPRANGQPRTNTSPFSTLLEA